MTKKNNEVISVHKCVCYVPLKKYISVRETSDLLHVHRVQKLSSHEYVRSSSKN